jgi:hypothetical protein
MRAADEKLPVAEFARIQTEQKTEFLRIQLPAPVGTFSSAARLMRGTVTTGEVVPILAITSQNDECYRHWTRSLPVEPVSLLTSGILSLPDS